MLSDLIGADLAETDGETRAMLGFVAVRGRDMSHDTLARLADMPAPELERAVRTALDRRYWSSTPARRTTSAGMR